MEARLPPTRPDRNPSTARRRPCEEGCDPSAAAQWGSPAGELGFVGRRVMLSLGGDRAGFMICANTRSPPAAASPAP
jgi:hypothetical protein